MQGNMNVKIILSCRNCSAPSRKFRNITTNYATIASFHIFDNSSFTNNPNIRHNTTSATDSVNKLKK